MNDLFREPITTGPERAAQACRPLVVATFSYGQPTMPLTYAVNSLNHSVGQPDLYPFVLAPTVMGKLRFIQGLVHQVKLPGSATSPIIAA